MPIRFCLLSVVLLSLTLLSTSLATASDPVEGYDVGQFFPGLRYQELNSGEIQSIHTYRGKKILLIQFASW